MEYGSFRQAGKEILGKVYRGPVVDAYNRLTQPSIPSKSDKLLHSSPEKGGFGCSASRFSGKKYAKLPGPGDYSESRFENPSVSKKGFGGLTNSAPRFKKFQYVNIIPGPGSYEIKSSTSQSFVISTSKTKSLKKTEIMPAPGQYDPLIPEGKKHKTSMFKSKTKRLESPNQANPAPWQYTPSYSLTRSSSTSLTSAFKMPTNARRHQINLYDPHAPALTGITPGPGDYNPNSIGEPVRSSSMFIVSEKDRFGHAIKPRVVDITPGPGYYGKNEHIEKTQVSGAVFMSESERKTFITEKKPPGPAFYKPLIQPKKKSFHLKPKNVWVS